MCATTIASSLAKSEIMEFSYPVVYAAAGIIVPFPVENSKNLVDTAAFQVPVRNSFFIISISNSYILIEPSY